MKMHDYNRSCCCSGCVYETKKRKEAAAHGRSVICNFFVWAVLLGVVLVLNAAIGVGDAAWNVGRYAIALRLLSDQP